MRQVAREARGREVGVYDRLKSIEKEAEFAQEVANLFPSLPRFVNLRCGAWCLPPPREACYFKSNDGHSHSWRFPPDRLNCNVALRAVQSGGCLLVDATASRVKRLPDAFAKTVPIWACVVSFVCLGKGAEIPLPELLHLPQCVPWMERAEIEELLPSFAQVFEESCPSETLSFLKANLTKPLRPLFVSPGKVGWDRCTNPPPAIQSLPFYPLVLVSASDSFGSGGFLHEAGKAGFAYVPGSADDEKEWAKGVGPDLFWDNASWLLAGAREGVEGRLNRLAESHGMVWRRAELPQFTPAGLSVDAPESVDGRPHPIGNTGMWIASLDFLQRVKREGQCGFRRILFLGQKALQEGEQEKLWESLLELPVCSSKLDRKGLIKSAPKALAFIGESVREGGCVLVACEDGRDRSVGVVVLALIGLFGGDKALDGGSALPEPRRPQWLSRDGVRRVLSAVSEDYPAACPAKGTMKQVFQAARSLDLGEEGEGGDSCPGVEGGKEDGPDQRVAPDDARGSAEAG